MEINFSNIETAASIQKNSGYLQQELIHHHEVL